MKTLKTNKRIVLILLVFSSLLFGYFIIKDANWTWGDDYEFLISTAVGKMEWDIHVANHGRLYPLGHSDYNILTLIQGATTPVAHYSIVLFSFFLFVFFSYKLYNIVLIKTNKSSKLINWIVLFSILFLFYYFYRLFFFLVYPERIMVVLLSLFFILYSKFLKTNQSVFAVFAVLVSIYLSYTKETSFIIFSVVAGIGLLFNYKNNSKKENWFYLALTTNIVSFLLVYYFIAYRTADTLYSRHSSVFEVIQFTVGNLKILYIALIASLWRVFVFLFRKDRSHLLIDILLFSGVLYAIANVILKMPMDYYYFPAVMLTFPALVYWGVKLLRPEWVLIVLILSTGYYYRKFPKVINIIQDLKISTHKNLVEFTNILNDSDKAYWLQYDDIDEVVKGKMGYQREILEVYYHFYNNEDEAIEIKNVNELPEELNSKIVLFYSDLQVASEEYDITLRQIDSIGFTQQHLPNIQDIKIFTK
ncbi:MAG: hypothetical protein BGO29_07205 [Bacteroidales bacterium 36-12]|nr:MAG: hypothetical protein BGO29_07205 [Bacteroidales bacterium 36-12]